MLFQWALDLKNVGNKSEINTEVRKTNLDLGPTLGCRVPPPSNQGTSPLLSWLFKSKRFKKSQILPFVLAASELPLRRLAI